MNTLKTMGIAVFVAAITAVSVVWYIDYKINQMTEAVMAPVHATTEKVTDTIDVVEDGVSTATGEISDQYEGALADLQYEWENAKGLAATAGSWLDGLRS